MIGVPGFKAFLGGFLVGDAVLEFFVGDLSVVIGVTLLEAGGFWVGFSFRSSGLRYDGSRLLRGLAFLDAVGVLTGFPAEAFGLLHEVFVARPLMGGDEGLELGIGGFGFVVKVGFLEG